MVGPVPRPLVPCSVSVRGDELEEGDAVMVRKSLVALIVLLVFVAIPTSAASAATTVTVSALSGPTDFGPPNSGFAGSGFTDSGVTLAPGEHAVITATGTGHATSSTRTSHLAA